MSQEIENIQQASITDTIKSAYLEYAMSVIVGRALPDVRDGLKPVHRRILYAMNNLNLSASRPYAKSARVVGDVVGKYHPHGDAAIYDALVRLAQDFSMRYQLVDGQGNFGSVDGDEPAAMRYTEVRLRRISALLIRDLDKNTVDFQPNYDNSLNEPVVFPTCLPTLLMNGSSGIAVGMATNIPPHNLSELLGAINYLIDNRKNYRLEELLDYIKGPDFPTAGQIVGRGGILSAYKTGRGVITVRGRAEFEQHKRQTMIVINELPYAVNKSRFVEQVADLASKGSLPISDVRDESDRQGMRVVIVLKTGQHEQTVLNMLYKQTNLQTSYGINMRAVINKQPKVLNLASILLHFIDHRIDVITRRTRFDLRKSILQLEIIEALIKALGDIDQVVAIIRNSENAKAAEIALADRHALSQRQAKAILDMRLQRLTSLEQTKLKDEQAKLKADIERFQAILADPKKLQEIIKTELAEIKQQYSDERRTEIIDDDSLLDEADLISPEQSLVTVSREGYVKRTALDEYQKQNRGGKGKLGMSTRAEDSAEHILVGSTHDSCLFFSSSGLVYSKKIYQLPKFSRTAKGRAIINLLDLPSDQRIVSLMRLPQDSKAEDELCLVMVTAQGVAKKTSLSEYRNLRNAGTKALVIDDGDSLVNVVLAKPDDRVFIATRHGWANMFAVDQLRQQGRVTRGPRGIRLREFKNGEQDYVVSMTLVQSGDNVVTVCERGIGKRNRVQDFRLGRRSNMGIVNVKVSARTGLVVGSLRCKDDDQVLIISRSGNLICLPAEQISRIGRYSQGVKLMKIAADDKVVSIGTANKF